MSCALTQCTETSSLVYPDFYPPDTMDSRLSQISYQMASIQPADENLVAVVKMKNLASLYPAESNVFDVTCP